MVFYNIIMTKAKKILNQANSPKYLGKPLYMKSVKSISYTPIVCILFYFLFGMLEPEVDEYLTWK